MSMELRFKKMKESWMEVQKLREEKVKWQKKRKEAETHVRRLSQEIPKKLNEFNSIMV